jgi:SMC interacting uncharacterized protein involved in chromosome segregation
VIIALAAVPAVLTADATSAGSLPEWATILISVILSAGGAGTIVKLLTIRADKRQLAAGTDKMEMEAADILTKSAVVLLTPLREELARANAKINELDVQVGELKATLNQERITSEVRIRQLETQIAERDRELQVQGAEIIDLRSRVKSAPGWPGA